MTHVNITFCLSKAGLREKKLGMDNPGETGQRELHVLWNPQ